MWVLLGCEHTSQYNIVLMAHGPFYRNLACIRIYVQLTCLEVLVK